MLVSVGTLIHVGETAALLLVAYVVGWGIGLGLRRATARWTAVPSVILTEAGARLVEAPMSDAVVATPQSVATGTAPAPAAPSELPAEVLVALEGLGKIAVPEAPVLPPLAIAPVDDVVPPPFAAETVPIAADPAPALSEAAPEPVPLAPPPQPVIEASPAPVEAPMPKPQPVEPPTPTSRAGVAWAGAIRGHAAPDQDTGVAATTALPEPAAMLPPAAGVPEPEPPAPPMVDELPTVEAPTAAPVLGQPAAEPAEPASARSTPAPAPAPVIVDDEDAAMRAIEGGWSRRDAPPLPYRPESLDVGAAVAKAQTAVEDALARNGVEATEPSFRANAAFGRPVGLPRARDGARDELKRIDGLGQLDELALNNLGIFHFDQVAAWDQREVLWLENHAFAVGRIGRERWQEQARLLEGERPSSRFARL